MKVNEIFESIQGESSWAGLPMIFVRLFGCNLRCSYCDTMYSVEGNDWKDMSPVEVGDKILEYENGIVEFTGGEPLLWSDKIIEVMKYLREKEPDRAWHFLIETNGALNISKFIKLADENRFQNYYFILDIKTPSSGMFDKMIMENLNQLRGEDEVKFVCGTMEDFDIAKKIITDLNLANAIISPVFGKVSSKELVGRILKEKVRCRFQLQMHKFIWDPDKRGV